LELSSIPALNIEKRLGYLSRYPHGCLEQTTSAVFPQLYLSNVMSLSEKQQKKSEFHVRKAIEKLQRFQNADGDFSYWPGNGSNNKNEWASIYAGHFLIEAKKLGYVVPNNLLRKWLKYQSTKSQNYVTSSQNYSHTQAYRLYALALSGKPQLGAMNRMREAANVAGAKTLNKKARWLLASAYQAASQPAAAEALIQGMSLDSVDKVEASDKTFSSTLGDLGLRLESLVALNKKQDANKLLEQIASQMNSDEYQNTQGIAWALMSVARYLDGDTSSFTAKLNEGETATEINSKQAVNRSRLVNPDADIKVQNTSKIKLFANLVSSGVPSAGDEITQQNGLEMMVYYASRDSGNDENWKKIEKEQTNWQVKQGNDALIVAIVKNTSKRDLENIALTIPAAAGFEILEGTEQAKKGSQYDYRDLRDDRANYYFSLKKNESKEFTLLANASYKGRYYQPAIFAEAMYEGKVKATQKGLWLDIAKEIKPKTDATTTVVDAK